jgi:hypothetical protein
MVKNMNTIPTTAENIEWLLEKLFLAKRDLESVGKDNGNVVFVLLTKSESERMEVEKRIFAYMAAKYGFDLNNLPTNYDVHPLDNSSTFRFPNGITITLINL